MTPWILSHIAKLSLRKTTPIGTVTVTGSKWLQDASTIRKNVAITVTPDAPGAALFEIPFGIPYYYEIPYENLGIPLKGRYGSFFFFFSFPSVAQAQAPRGEGIVPGRSRDTSTQRMLLGRRTLANGKPSQHRSRQKLMTACCKLMKR
jgi:hypothetical protein